MNKKYYAMVVLVLSVGMIAPAVIVSAATQAERPSVSSVANDTGKSKPKSANSAEALRAENRTKDAVNSTHNMNNNMHDDSVGRGGSGSSGGHGGSGDSGDSGGHGDSGGSGGSGGGGGGGHD